MSEKKKNPAAVALGKKRFAGASKSEPRRIGRLGGRPRKYPPCPKAPRSRPGIHQWNPQTGECWYCGYDRSRAK